MNGSFIVAGLIALAFVVDLFSFGGHYSDVVSHLATQIARHFRLI